VHVVLDAEGDVIFEVLIDGVPTTTFQTSRGEGTFTLASGLPAGEHDVLIFRRTEAFFNAVSFIEFQIDGGDLVPSPAPHRHRLEFIGDSITAGYGALGAGPDCSFSAETESAYADLIRLIRSRHTTAAIYCVGGDFLNATATAYITNALAAVGDANVHLLELPGVEASEGWGCDWHPSAATHTRIGGLVADRLRSDLGW